MKGWAAARLAVAWATVVLMFAVPDAVAGVSESPAGAALLFVALLGVIVWSTFGVVEAADGLAERLGEPYGALVLTLAIVIIEVALIGAVMLAQHPVYRMSLQL